MKTTRPPNLFARTSSRKAHIKEHPAWFHRFKAVWTPTVLLLDKDGKERVRLEGYLPSKAASRASVKLNLVATACAS
jgi:thioredoxin-related protein